MPAAFYDLSDSDVEAELVGYSEYEAQPDLIDTSTLGASIARHELIKLEETESDDQRDDGKSTEILGLRTFNLLRNIFTFSQFKFFFNLKRSNLNKILFGNI